MAGTATTTCQTRCRTYGMSQTVATSPEDCGGLIDVGPVPGRAGGGCGYTFQVCPRRSYAALPPRHIKPFPDESPHIVVLHRASRPSDEELREIADSLDEHPDAHLERR